MTHPEGDSIMKYAHIGLVALAAMVVAGCGGGSDNGGGGGSFNVEDLSSNGLEAALVAVEGETYEVAPGKTHEVDVDGGKILISGCPDGCSVTVSRRNGQSVVMASVDDVEVEFKPTQTATQQPPPPPPATGQRPPPATTETNTALEQERQRNRQLQQDNQQLQDRLASAQDGPRAENLVSVLAELATNAPTRTGVVVGHQRGQNQDIRISGLRNAKSTSLDGWAGIELSAASGAYGEKAYLYTNLDDPKTDGARRQFWKVYGIAPLDVVVSNGDVAHSSTPIQIDGTSATPFRKKGTPASDPFDGVRVRATYGGTSGWLVCDGGDCDGDADTDEGADDWIWKSFQLTDKKIPGSPSEGDWQFEAGSLTARHDSAVEDETYLYFGYWMNTPTVATEDPRFNWIHGGSAVLADTSTLTGTARYAGPAVGQYAINTPGETGVSRFGMFTATATLDADFTESTDMVSGSITNFKADSTSTAGWTLLLRGTGAAPAAEIASGVTTGGEIQGTDDASKISGVQVSGNWGASLYGVPNTFGGNTVAPADRPPGHGCDQHPGCAADVAGFAGWFRARAAANAQTVSESNPAIVSIAGAFAAD
ncbi:MAG: hypothetical protein OXC65_04790 [Thiotrichales bacterium]|nr:hypothetical protein [Thiotrichales bacterium]MCY4284645.1 hypothetical protein [Thiotrichales bacterium]